MSTGTGMEAVYAIKAQRAAEYIADPSPADANYPLLALEAAELGISTAELASTVQTMSGQWEAFAGSIEAIRVSRKAQVDLAETPDEITAIEAAIEWPSLA
jgi:ActR/RegA family two-component response regulator